MNTNNFKQLTIALEKLREENAHLKDEIKMLEGDLRVHTREVDDLHKENALLNAKLKAKQINTELRGYDGLVDEIGKLRKENERLKDERRQDKIFILDAYALKAEYEQIKDRNAELVEALKHYWNDEIEALDPEQIYDLWMPAKKALKNNEGGE